MSASIESPAHIDAAVARRTANGYLTENVGDLLMAGAPSLSADRRWTMPILLGSSRRGEIGEVGTIFVDSRTGEVLFSEDDRTEVEARVRLLVDAAAP